MNALSLQGTYDPRESLAVNTSLSGPLLSRFDIVLVLRDQRNVNWDEAVADHILNGAESAEGDATSTVISSLPSSPGMMLPGLHM